MMKDEPDFEARKWLRDDDIKFRIEVGIVGDISVDFKRGDSGEIMKGRNTGCGSFTKGDVIVSLDCDDVAEGDIYCTSSRAEKLKVVVEVSLVTLGMLLFLF